MSHPILLLAQSLEMLAKLDDVYPDLATAKSKIESLLVKELKTQTTVSNDITRAVINTLSLRAVKALPKDAHIGQAFYGRQISLNLNAILRQPRAFLVAAKAKGIKVDDTYYRKLIDDICTNAGAPTEQNALILDLFEPESSLFAHLLSFNLKADATKSRQIGPFVAQILRKIAKKDKDGVLREFAKLSAMFHPGAAHPIYYKQLAVFGLLKIGKPKNALFVHKDIADLYGVLTSTAGRTALETDCGSLEEYLGGKHLTPKGVIQTYIQKRATWSLPQEPRTPSRGYRSFGRY